MTEEASREYKNTFHAFLRQHPTRSYSKREIILQQGEAPEVVHILKSGIIKSYNLTPQGEEKPITFILKEEAFPIGWALSRTAAAQYYYETLTPCEVYLIPVAAYLQFLQSESGCLFELYKSMVDRSVEYQMRINALEQSRAGDKVLHTLNFLVHRFGKDEENDIVKIELPFTQQDMANFMGIARETTAIELKKLERQGILTYRHHVYTISMHKLRQLLGDEDASSTQSIHSRQFTPG